ncbi:MAG: sugar phosphate nucleotidyltransferase [Bacillota bacterium]|nr:sugar phosphate nucleotidyltransferase [Bacillota bacterium]
MKAVVMAGGQGTRLRPLSCDLPKPMVPLMNRPMLEHILLLLKAHGIVDIAVTTCYLPEAIEAHFGDGHQLGLRLRYFLEEAPLGTAGSVKNAEEFLDEPFLVISGDALTDFDLNRLISFHKEREALATIGLTRVDNPLEYGVVITGADGRVRRFLEKPSWSEVFSDTVNTGIYALDPRVLDFLKRGENVDFSKNLFPLLLGRREPLFGCVLEGYWSDIGNLEQYRQSHYDVLGRRVKLARRGTEIVPGVFAGEGTEVAPGVELSPPVVLGDFVRVEEGVELGPEAVVGDHAVLRSGASVKRSVIWSNTVIDRRAEIRGAVVADRVFVRAGAAVFEGAIVGKGVQIGARAQVKPGVKIWPGKVVDPGLVLTESLVWGSRSPRALFSEAGVSGMANADLTPEFAARLGAAYGAELKPGARVVAGCDDYPAAGMVKQALATGLTSSGVHVVDLGPVVGPAVRYAVQALEAAGGVYVRRSPREDDQVLLEFVDSRGIDVDKGLQRRVENLFFREDFARVEPERVGRIIYFPRAVERYLSGLLLLLDRETVRRAAPAVVATAGASPLGLLLPSLLRHLGCRVQLVEAPPGSGAATPDEIGAETVRSGAALGVLADPAGESLVLVDETGRVIPRETVELLVALLALKQGGSVVAPVTAPGAVEKLAARFERQVVRTKTSLRERLEAERRLRSGSAPYFHTVSDALLTLARILEAIAKEGVPLSRLVAEVPVYHTVREQVPCDWKAKGRVMRSLLEEFGSEEGVDLTDGLKVHPTGEDDAWVLVQPDADAPYFHLVSEGRSLEEADELIAAFRQRIKALEGKSSLM